MSTDFLRGCPISVIFVSDPFLERVPPLILRAITAGRTARSAALFSEGASGYFTKINNFGKNRFN